MSVVTEKYVWLDYDPEAMESIENWLDPNTVKATGLDQGFHSFYAYWAKEEGFAVGENFWCKVVFESGAPIAFVALCLHAGTVLIMEIVVDPQRRGQGLGATLLKALLERKDVLGFSIEKSEAVIFPDNTPSQKAFEKAGFRHHHTYEDDTAMLYVYEKK